MRLTRLLTAVLAISVGLLGAAPVAAAGTRPVGPVIAIDHGPRPVIGLHRLAHSIIPEATQWTSTTWSGWVDAADTNVELRYVTANFTVPTTHCPSYGAEAGMWVGLDGWYSTSKTVEQVGVVAECVIQTPSGVMPAYVSFWEMYPNGPVVKNYVSPGDTIAVSVYFNSSTDQYGLALSDSNTTSPDINVSKYCPSGYTCHNSSAEVIVEDPGNGGPANGNYLANFGKVSFSNIAVTSRNGTHGTLEGNSPWSANEVTMKYNGIVMAQPSDRTNGYTAFTDTYKSSG